MKSSSRFFPVRLISAEVQDGLAEDVYLIKPNNSPDKSVEVAVTHLSYAESNSASETERPVIVLLHGCFQNRRLWFTPGVSGVAKQLLKAGCDVWLVEHRGHGMSPSNQRANVNALGDYARYDIPAANTFIAEQVGSCPHWLGANEGAAVLLMSVASGSLAQDTIGSISGLGHMLPSGRARLPGAHWSLLNKLQRNPVVGPEPEHLSLCRTLWRQASLFSTLGAEIGLNLKECLASLQLPILWFNDQDKIAGLGHPSSFQMVSLSGDADLLNPENQQKNLTDEAVVNMLIPSLLSFIQGERPDGLLPAGKTSSTI